MIALYRRLLGEDFERLPPLLRAFHDAEGGGRADAIMQITRGKGLLHRVLGWIAGLPDEGERVETVLEVKVERDRERWIRTFAGKRVESIQWAEGSFFAETAGPFVFLFELEIDRAGRLHFHFAQVRFFGIRLPRSLCPSCRSIVLPHDEGWEVDVEMRAPILSTILRYRGIVRPRS